MTDNLFEQLKRSRPFFLIAGPCVIEDEKTMMQTAETLVRLTSELSLPFVFKASFLKANRTSPDSFRGPGLQEGLQLLQKIKTTFSVPLLTDVHETTDINAVQEVVDIIQIPAFLSRQTLLIQAAAQTGKIVNLKKGQFMAPEDMRSAAAKVTSMHNQQVLLTERGTSFGYHNLVVDFRSFQIMHQIGFPVVYDVTHSLQKPSVTDKSGGSPEFVQMMAQAALATGFVDGLFIETHPHPEKALSDAASMLALDQLPALLKSCIKIKEALQD
ncbi:MAG: 3-deoxy-8-phosphooctulonate synthase [Candidatus Cloacimonadaceae bacterium]